MAVALHWTLYGLAALLFGVGVVGCVVPVLPGPLAAYAGVLCLLATPRSPGIAGVVAMGAVAVGVTILDTVIPGWGAKRFECSNWGAWGSVGGAIVGVFFFPWGLVAGPFLGAVAGELVAGRRLGAATKSGIGALLGFLCGVFVKLAACAFMAGMALSGGDLGEKADLGGEEGVRVERPASAGKTGGERPEMRESPEGTAGEGS